MGDFGGFKDGAVIYKDLVPVEKETLKICEIYGIDYLRLISSGCMMITCKRGPELVKKLNSNGIKATIIGKVTGDGERKLVCGDRVLGIGESGTDELYKTQINSH